MKIGPAPKWVDIAILTVFAPVWIPGIALLIALIAAASFLSRTFGAQRHWTRWFAWRPVSLDHGFGDRVWLEMVERADWYGRTIYRRPGDAAVWCMAEIGR